MHVAIRNRSGRYAQIGRDSGETEYRNEQKNTHTNVHYQVLRDIRQREHSDHMPLNYKKGVPENQVVFYARRVEAGS
jgi:hypothetical protein